MDGSFRLNEPGWYEVELFQENDFINKKLETKEYGIWYSVKFVGDAETYLWQTKTEPKEGEKYWGFITKTKSGAPKFKWDKQHAPTHLPSGEPSTYTKQEDAKGKSIANSMAVKLAYHAFIQTETMLPKGQEHWDVIFDNAKNIKFLIDELDSGQAAVPTPAISGKEEILSSPATGSLRASWDKVSKSDEPEYTDEEMP